MQASTRHSLLLKVSWLVVAKIGFSTESAMKRKRRKELELGQKRLGWESAYQVLEKAKQAIRIQLDALPWDDNYSKRPSSEGEGRVC